MNAQQNTAALFVGSFTHTLDAKRRMIFPSSWRNLAGDSNQLFAFPHPEEKCLYLYTAAEMMRRIDELRNSGSMDANDQQAIRSITAGAELLMWDAQGRVRIGENLLAHIEVKEQIVLVGALTRIELWSSENFDLALPQESSAAENVFFGGY
ncbi:division/cell wall cluster transcriptional repressor MraZ [Pontiella sp.]|uniref:division/cell wall cluster transcriptional repressor MraZ n=1 Tax=Pontiella sp. TaxID=2837462 RepID=UPI0035669038